MKLVHVQPVIMPYREIDRGHAVEIGAVELPLAARPVPHRLAENFRQHVDHRIENRNMGNPAFGAAALELGPKVLINDTHQENAGIAVDAGENGIDMMQAANKGPNMFGRPDIGKLRDTGAGHLMHGFTRRIGYQMKVEQAVRHDRKNRTAGDGCHEISLPVACGKAVP
mgnify:FL=1